MMLHGWGRAGWVTMIAQRLGVQTWIDWGKRHRVCWEAAFGTITGHIKSCHWVMMCSCALEVAGTAVKTTADTYAWLMSFFGAVDFRRTVFDAKKVEVLDAAADNVAIQLVGPDNRGSI